MRKIRKGDQVVVIAGKDRGRRGTVLQVVEEGRRVIVEGINVAKKHQRPNPNAVPPIEGGIVDKEMPIAISNVMVFNPKTKKGDRVGFQVDEDGVKRRVFKSTGEPVDV
ncbi:MAG TPA: 50S ribosomal protein L24 [Woeseiaceae bacterium]|nr:50S ribosomal protein L24 [Woeseiaceae bacterium]